VQTKRNVEAWGLLFDVVGIYLFGVLAAWNLKLKRMHKL